MLQRMVIPVGGNSGSKVSIGTFTMATTNTKVTTGFKPKYIGICFGDGSTIRGIIYNEDVSSTKYLSVATGSSAAWATLNGSNSVCLVSVDNDGFTVKVSGSTYTGTYNYFAIE